MLGLLAAMHKAWGGALSADALAAAYHTAFHATPQACFMTRPWNYQLGPGEDRWVGGGA